MFLTFFNTNSEKITVYEGTGATQASVKTANALSEYNVIPSGEAIGVKLYTDGVFVVGAGNISDMGEASPAKKAGVKAGDRIVAAEGFPVTDTESLKRLINSGNRNVTLSIIRDGSEIKIPIEAIYSKETDSYLIGLWVRDSAAGIGTLTFYNPKNSTFAALGHGICDYDTDALLFAQSGWVGDCRIKGAIKSKNGSPGELLGDFSETEIGKILINAPSGLYGNAVKIPDLSPVPVASRFEVQEGSAQFLCDIDGKGAKEYDIKITKLYRGTKPDGKNFVFKVCDPVLLERTGGIVQGMSGSPILQNGKLIGAVTHVFVNDSSRGYGIFAENMLDITNTLN